MSLNQRITTEFSPCTPSAPQFRDLSIQTYRSTGLLLRNAPDGIPGPLGVFWDNSDILQSSERLICTKLKKDCCCRKELAASLSGRFCRRTQLLDQRPKIEPVAQRSEIGAGIERLRLQESGHALLVQFALGMGS